MATEAETDHVFNETYRMLEEECESRDANDIADKAGDAFEAMFGIEVGQSSQLSWYLYAVAAFASNQAYAEVAEAVGVDPSDLSCTMEDYRVDCLPKGIWSWETLGQKVEEKREFFARVRAERASSLQKD